MATFEQYMAESGRQSELDQLGRTGQLETAKAKWLSGQGAVIPTASSFSNASMVGNTAVSGIKPTKPYDQYMAESGQQSTLDQQRATGQYETARSQYESGAGVAGSSTGASSGISGLMTTQPTINLPSLYQNLYSSSGITENEKQYSDLEKAYIEAKGKINDNPFLSEATRVGRVAKLETLFNERTANIKNDIATKKADIETKLNLETKQFDINSQQATQALNQFNSLLSAGALDNASGEDIANITRATGISSTMIQSAIQASVKSKQKEIPTQVIKSEADDGTVTISVVNSQTGEVIKQSNLGKIGNVQSETGATTPAKNVKAQFLSDADTLQGQKINNQYWGQFPQLVQKYAPYYTLEEIYSLYLSTSLGKKYGTPGESAKEMKELYDYSRTGKEPKEEEE